ncbi:MAG: PIN domain-containing protein [Propionibacteriaceae bacterium]|jgi:tRNA(fMet)-specific endonuclease VapC|nr:PIN domain-containing protein [Propionibacteriaceae bacterium]
MNVLVAIMRGRAGAWLARRMDQHSGELGVSAVTVMELQTGVFLSGSPAATVSKVDRVLARLQIWPFDEAAARVAGEVRARLIKAGLEIGPYDSEIAGHALALGAVLVTNNVREFSRVDGLSVEDWLAPASAEGGRQVQL